MYQNATGKGVRQYINGRAGATAALPERHQQGGRIHGGASPFCISGYIALREAKVEPNGPKGLGGKDARQRNQAS